MSKDSIGLEKQRVYLSLLLVLLTREYVVSTQRAMEIQRERERRIQREREREREGGMDTTNKKGHVGVLLEVSSERDTESEKQRHKTGK